MMGTVPVLRLSRDQFAQLTAHLSAYRSYLWQSIMPTPERNQTIRSIQAMQGRLEQEQGKADIALCLTAEEASALKQLFSGLIQLYGTAPPSEQRMQTLAELTSLRLLVERTFRQTQAL